MTRAFKIIPIAQAEKEARIAVRLCPNDPSVQVMLADILLKSDMTEAYASLNRAKEIYAKKGLTNEVAKVNNKILQLQSQSSR